MTDAPRPAPLRARAEALGQALPPLLAEAERLAASLTQGGHGRRRAGAGSDFWQYRQAAPGDALRSIDWRRSARSDVTFVREREWQAAQSVVIWVDPSAAMALSGDPARRPAKHDRAALVALALAVALLRAGERVGVAGAGADLARPGAGVARLPALALALTRTADAEFGQPPRLDGCPAQGRAVFLSDFLGPTGPLRETLVEASGRGIRGLLVQVLDPIELAFPFAGRIRFLSPGGGGLTHETDEAQALRTAYLARLDARRAEVEGLARTSGWRFARHVTDGPALPLALWAHQALAATGRAGA